MNASFWNIIGTKSFVLEFTSLLNVSDLNLGRIQDAAAITSSTKPYAFASGAFRSATKARLHSSHNNA